MGLIIQHTAPKRKQNIRVLIVVLIFRTLLFFIQRFINHENKVNSLFSNEMRQNWLKKGVRYVGAIDIETSGLKGNFDYMISWVLFVYDVKTGKIVKRVYDILNRKDKNICVGLKITQHKDKRILESLLRELNGVNLLVGFYSGFFDIPFIRTRCYVNKIDYFPYKTMRYYDLWKFARFSLSINRNGLDSVSRTLTGKTNKTRLDGDIWQMARDLHPQALNYILIHNITDVKDTMKVFLKVVRYINIPSKYL